MVRLRAGAWARVRCDHCGQVEDADGTCICPGSTRECDEMRAPYQGPPCICRVCKKRRGEGLRHG
jgi:hypothetical protein